jgi:hypothetical protein
MYRKHAQVRISKMVALWEEFPDRTVRISKMLPPELEAAKEEVRKLLEAQVIREVIHTEWLANPMHVKRSNEKWRMCVDFTSLNTACPKDDFTLSRIDHIIDFTAGCQRLCFLDAYSGYPQVWMVEEDEPHTSFITPFGTYCFTRMPFGLRMREPPSRSSSRRFSKTELGEMWRRAWMTMWCTCSWKEEDLFADLRETFGNLRRMGMRLNPKKKCTFRVHSGKLLGYLVSQQGIKANP